MERGDGNAERVITPLKEESRSTGIDGARPAAAAARPVGRGRGTAAGARDALRWSRGERRTVNRVGPFRAVAPRGAPGGRRARIHRGAVAQASCGAVRRSARPPREGCSRRSPSPGLPAPGTDLDGHYLDTMPAQLAVQLRAAGRRGGTPLLGPPRPAPPASAPRGLDRLFALVAGAGVACARAIGATTPQALLAARPTLGSCMRAATSAAACRCCSLSRRPRRRGLAGTQPGRAHRCSLRGPSTARALPPAPSRSGPGAGAGQPARGARRLDRVPRHGRTRSSRPGAARTRSGSAVVRRRGRVRGPSHRRAGSGARASGRAGLARPARRSVRRAMRCYGWLGFLESGAPHLLSDAFHPERWWKLIDLHRDLRLARAFHAAHVEPLLRSVPARGTPLRAAWDEALDALSWSELPCSATLRPPATTPWRCAPCARSTSAPSARGAPSEQRGHILPDPSRSTPANACCALPGPTATRWARLLASVSPLAVQGAQGRDARRPSLPD